MGGLFDKSWLWASEQEMINEAKRLQAMSNTAISSPGMATGGIAMAPPQENLLAMIQMRMRVRAEHRMFDFIQAYRISPEKVVVFIVNGDQPITLEDDGGLFPSDQLITKLRLIRQG